MTTSPEGGSPDTGEVSRYLLLSDMHLNNSRVDGSAVMEQVEAYVDEYDCEAIVLGGDQKMPEEQYDSFCAMDVERVYAVWGNNDESFDWYGSPRREQGDTELHLDECVVWSEEVEDAVYDFILTHSSHDLNISPLDIPAEEKTTGLKDSQIALTGHSHMPVDGAVEDHLFIVMGSSGFQNYNRHKEDGEANIPETSAHILTLSRDELALRHLDFWNRELVEESRYEHTGDGFELLSELWTWQTEDRQDGRWV